MIRSSGDQYIICILKCWKGKIVDIIRFHQDQSEQDFDSLVAQISREFAPIVRSGHQTQDYIASTFNRQKSQTCVDAFSKLMSNAIDSHIYAQIHQDSTLVNTILQSLQKKYQLSCYPYHIECIDISHLQ